MKIIRLGDIHDKESYITGPREFIDYINNAAVLLTDSFMGLYFLYCWKRHSLFMKERQIFQRCTQGLKHSSIGLIYDIEKQGM